MKKWSNKTLTLLISIVLLAVNGGLLFSYYNFYLSDKMASDLSSARTENHNSIYVISKSIEGKSRDEALELIELYIKNNGGYITIKDNNGVVDTSYYYKSGNVSKEIYKDSDTNEVSERYYRDGAYNPYKEVRKNKAGNVEQTTTYRNTKEGEHISSVTKNADGKTTHTANYDKNGNVKSETYYYFDGSTQTDTNGKHGTVLRVNKNADGKVTETEQYFYDAKGREAKIVKKDAEGNITETSTTTYGKNSSSRTEKRDANGNLKEVYILNKNKEKFENYFCNRLLCTEETSSGNKPVYKNAAGEVITEKEYYNLLKPRFTRLSDEV